VSGQAGVADQRPGRIGLGMVMVLVGVAIVAWPRATAIVVVTLFGLGVLLYGLLELSRVFSAGDEGFDLVAGLAALINIFGGIVIFVTRFVSVDALAVVLGVYWVVAGVVALVAASTREVGRVERFAVGVLSLTAGALALALPALSLVVLVWFAGAWLILVGVLVAGLTLVGSSGARTDGELPPIR
jgi:uncharacterized membrane protein HdeD (DUF308 family)